MNCEIVWIVKDSFIGKPYLDATAADFLLNQVTRVESISNDTEPSKQQTNTSRNSHSLLFHASIGPHWLSRVKSAASDVNKARGLEICLNTMVVSVQSGKTWDVSVDLSNGRVVEADVVVRAIYTLNKS